MTTTGGHTQGTSDWAPTRDGRLLHAMALPGPDPRPTGTPTVVFEAGAAADRSSWALVQPRTGDLTRAIVYDRAGLGRSASDTDRSLARMADDLNDLLDHVEPGPFVLVGHSAGGPIVRLAAAHRPDRIAGLVLVDPTDEAAPTLFRPGFRRAERSVIAASSVLARLGLLRPMFRWLLRDLPDDVRADLEREGFTPGIVRTQRRQARTFLDELAVWRDDPPDLGEVPVTVISGAMAGGGMTAAIRAEVNAAHAIRADRCPGGRHVIGPASGHYVPITEPHLVVAEIARLLPGRPEA